MHFNYSMFLNLIFELIFSVEFPILVGFNSKIGQKDMDKRGKKKNKKTKFYRAKIKEIVINPFPAVGFVSYFLFLWEICQLIKSLQMKIQTHLVRRRFCLVYKPGLMRPAGPTATHGSAAALHHLIS